MNKCTSLKIICMLFPFVVSLDSIALQILSRDSVTVSVDAVVYYQVKKPAIAVSRVQNFRWVRV